MRSILDQPLMSVTPLQSKPSASGYRMVARGTDRAEIYLYGTVGADWFGEGVTAKQFAADLKGLGKVKTIDLRINSDGGSVFEGKTIYSLLAEHPAKVITRIDGLAASIASLIAMAGDEIHIAEGGFVMIHNAWTFTMPATPRICAAPPICSTPSRPAFSTPMSPAPAAIARPSRP
jgi:ATP-dependent Clp protease protease subunit